MNASNAPRPSDTLGERYLLEEIVGRGATSVVFKARDLRLERQVAVKVLSTLGGVAAEHHRARFASEARILARLSHPHVVTIHDFADSGNLVYLVMELVTAGTLQSELSRRTLSDGEILSLLVPIMGGLACAHDRGIVHRDIKPSNIVLERAGDNLARGKLLDFGIARDFGRATLSRAIMGTPAYMAPEQINGGELGPFTDVWAMGVTLFRCLTGQLPFPTQGGRDVMRAIREERAPRFGSLRVDLVSLGLAIDRALDPNPKTRFQDMRELARAVAQACVHDGIALSPDADPMGLPELREWIQLAKSEDTLRQDPLPAELAAGFDEPRDTEHSVSISAPLPELQRVELPRHMRRSAFALLCLCLVIPIMRAEWTAPAASRAPVPDSPKVGALVDPPGSPSMPLEPVRPVVSPLSAEPSHAGAALTPPRPPAARGGMRAKARALKPPASAVDVPLPSTPEADTESARRLGDPARMREPDILDPWSDDPPARQGW